MAKRKLDLKMRAGTLPTVAKKLAEKWPNGLPRNREVAVGMAGGTVALFQTGTKGDIVDARWGGPAVSWDKGMNLPTWLAELKCGYKMARAGASAARIKRECRVPRGSR